MLVLMSLRLFSELILGKPDPPPLSLHSRMAAGELDSLCITVLSAYRGLSFGSLRVAPLLFFSFSTWLMLS